MQIKSQQITPTFAPEMEFDIEVEARSSQLDPVIPPETPSQHRFFVAQEIPEWRGVRFSALND